MACLSTPLRLLSLLPAELHLSAVLKCGQSFRWTSGRVHVTRWDARRDNEALSFLSAKEELESCGEEWSMAWRDRTVVLRQIEDGLLYRSLFNPDRMQEYDDDCAHDTTRKLIEEYFNLSVQLAPLYEQWKDRDPIFKKKVEGGKFWGIRLLKQDEFETLICFICSSNNNIQRIALMISRLCERYGEAQPHPHTYQPLSSISPSTPSQYLYSFPSPIALSSSSVGMALRNELGFGYRASYVSSTVQTLLSLSSSSSPDAYLRTLGPKFSTYETARESLLKFTGVGPKVADCILLLGMGFTDVVPIDVHVWRIGIEQYKFATGGGASKAKGKTMNKGVYEKIQTAFKDRWGDWAGWAQQILFTSDLREFKAFEWGDEVGDIKSKLNLGIKMEEQEQELSMTNKKRKIEHSTSIPAKKENSTTDEYPTPKSMKSGKVMDLIIKEEDKTSLLSLGERVKRRKRTCQVTVRA